jgi:hypothetical protein
LEFPSVVAVQNTALAIADRARAALADTTVDGGELATMREALVILRDNAKGLAGRMKNTQPTEGNWNVAVVEVVALWQRARSALDGKQ